MYSKRRLFVELKSVRDLYPLPIAMTDVYVVVQLHSHCNKSNESSGFDCANCLPIRSDTISIPRQEFIKFKFRHIFEIENFNCEEAMDGFISVQLFNECSFYFDMFSSKGERAIRCFDGNKRCEELRWNAATVSGQLLSNSCDSISSHITQSCSGSSLNSMETNQRVSSEEWHDQSMEKEMQRSKVAVSYDVEANSFDAGDRNIGSMRVSLAQLCRTQDPVSDKWYCITDPVNGGQLRLRTIFCGGSETHPDESQTVAVESVLNKTGREKIFDRILHEPKSMNDCDRDTSKAKERKHFHLRSYVECREEQRSGIWERAFGCPDEFTEKRRQGRLKEPKNKLFRDLARNVGIPKHWRSSVYASCTGENCCSTTI